MDATLGKSNLGSNIASVVWKLHSCSWEGSELGRIEIQIQKYCAVQSVCDRAGGEMSTGAFSVDYSEDFG